jgi:tape measure domain-containing protein
VNITKVVLEADSSSIKAATKDLNALQGSGQQAEKSVTGLGAAAKAAGAILASLAAAFSVREVIQYADEWTNASNRLKLVTSSSNDLANAQQTLLKVANETRAGFSSTAELFTVLTRSTRDLGLSQADIVGITKTLNQSFAVSGAAAGAMDGAIRQLSQGLQSGALRGDEFNSVAEQAPAILDAVAFSLKMGRGELREFAATGGITSAVLVKAIQDYADVIEDDFSKAQRTFGQSLQEARNNMLAVVGGSREVQSAVLAVGSSIVWLSEKLANGSGHVATFFDSIRFMAEEAAAMIHGPAFGDLPRLYDALSKAEAEYERSMRSRSSAGRQEAKAEVDRLRAMVLASEEMAQSQYNMGRAVDDARESLEDQAPAIQQVEQATDKAADAARDFVRSMDSAAAASTNTESAYVQLMGITDQVTVRTTRLTAEQRNASLANIDAQDSIDGIVEKMGKQKTVSAEMAQVTALMRNDISSAFADMMMNGSNAFDAIAKSFERMVYKMVADWAASGVMNALSKLTGGSGGFTSTLGNVLGGGGGGAATGGGILSSAGSAISGAGSAILGGAKAVGSGIMGAAAAIPGWGWALAGGAALAAVLSDKSTPSSNAGILLSDLPGVDASRKQGTTPFASGVSPVLFARREDFGTASQVAEALRAADQVVMDRFAAAGKSFQITGPQLSGFSETGAGSGQFFGTAAEDSKVALTTSQSVSKYMQELIATGARYAGITLSPSGSPDQMLEQLDMALAHGSHASGLDYVPFDNYRGNLHTGEAVITARGNEALGMMASALTEMRSIMAAVAQHTAKSARQLERWDFGGLPEERAFA